MTLLATTLLEAPASDELMIREPLAYLDAFDAVLNADYSFVAYKETHRETGAWCVRINGHPIGSALLHPNAIRIQARAATAQGRPWFTWGKGVDPTALDLRKVEFRVHVRDGDAVAVEIFVRLRRYDYSADEPRSVLFPWPSA